MCCVIFLQRECSFSLGIKNKAKASPLSYQYMTLRGCQLREAGGWGVGSGYVSLVNCVCVRVRVGVLCVY
jgi:hypothetical protein